MPIPAASASRGERKCTGRPSIAIRPSYWLCRPAMIFISVDLPAPFSPTSPWISPARSTKSTSRSAATPPNDLEMPRSSSRGAASSVMPCRCRSDQEVVLHPQHAGGILLGHDGTVGDDALGNAAARLLAGGDRRPTGDDGAAMDATARIAH